MNLKRYISIWLSWVGGLDIFLTLLYVIAYLLEEPLKSAVSLTNSSVLIVPFALVPFVALLPSALWILDRS